MPGSGRSRDHTAARDLRIGKRHDDVVVLMPVSPVLSPRAKVRRVTRTWSLSTCTCGNFRTMSLTPLSRPYH
ncbi:MAG: hypothetical protein ABIQ59_10800 [Nocardioidaceae bacterium]